MGLHLVESDYYYDTVSQHEIGTPKQRPYGIGGLVCLIALVEAFSVKHQGKDIHHPPSINDL